MKQTLFSLLVGTLLFTSCKKNDDSITTANVSSTIVTGNWRVTYYWDTDHDETSNFSGYTFTFAGSVVTATKTGSTITGTWSTGSDDSKIKLIIAFTSPSTFAELSEDWQVIERTDTKIRLQHISGGGGGTDYLTFEKN